MSTWLAIALGAVGMALFILWSFAMYHVGKQDGAKKALGLADPIIGIGVREDGNGHG